MLKFERFHGASTSERNEIDNRIRVAQPRPLELTIVSDYPVLDSQLDHICRIYKINIDQKNVAMLSKLMYKKLGKRITKLRASLTNKEV